MVKRTQNGQQDVDEQVSAASALEEDTHGREDDGEDDLANVTARGPKVSSVLACLGKAPLWGLARIARRRWAWLGEAYEAVKGILAVV